MGSRWQRIAAWVMPDGRFLERLDWMLWREWQTPPEPGAYRMPLAFPVPGAAVLGRITLVWPEDVRHA